MEEIIIATNNKGKVNEIKKILNGYKLLSLKDINLEIDIEEDGNTFEENAKKKAKEISKIVKKPCIGDDSGLCIEIFDNWPGLNTTRFLGENATDIKRNEYILEKMKDLKKEERKAKVICSIVFYDYIKSKYVSFTEEMEGSISEQIRGENGFGFDTIFELENGKTLAELSVKEKNEISARKKALEKLEKYLENKEENI